MEDPRRLKWLPYVRLLADTMKLKDWEIKVSSLLPDNTEHAASIGCINGRKSATIYFGDTFLDASPQEQRHTVVHELTHCHYSDCYHIACDQMPKDSYPGWVMCWEHGIDATADTLAPFMPLPPWDEE